MLKFLEVSNLTLFFYYLASNLIYLCLLVVAIFATTAHRRRLAGIRLERLKASPLAPPISLLVPAHNEEMTIVESVRSLLSLHYPALEVIVIDDGSTDRTLEELTDHFHLLKTDMLYFPEVPSQPVRAIYMSQDDRRLMVVEKEWGRNKADSVNAGLNAASSPYVCVVDADAVLQQDALLRIMGPLLTESRPVVAAGGIVRAANGSWIEAGEARDERVPRRPLEVLQVIEYLRAFLIGREGWAHFNLLLIISGAFGVFRRDIVRSVGGYGTGAIGEDLDLVTRLHRYVREQKEDYQVIFVPDPVCWTEVPSDLKSFSRQRARWHKGLFDVLWRNRDMVFNPRYGRVGWVAIPYLLVFELLAPIIELVGYTTIALAALLGVLDRQFFLAFLLFGYAFGTLISVGAVLHDEIVHRRYTDWRDVARLITFCFFEHFPYRQLHMFWCLRGMGQYLRGDVGWGQLQRVGFQPRKETQ